MQDHHNMSVVNNNKIAFYRPPLLGYEAADKGVVLPFVAQNTLYKKKQIRRRIYSGPHDEKYSKSTYRYIHKWHS